MTGERSPHQIVGLLAVDEPPCLIFISMYILCFGSITVVKFASLVYIRENRRAHSDCACMVTRLGATCVTDCHIDCTCTL